MVANAFIGKATQPTPKEVAAALGGTNAFWTHLVSDITEECHITEKEWSSYSPKAGWSLRLKQKKRNIVYLAPCHGCFQVAFVLGDKAMTVAKNTEFPAKVAKLIAGAPHYPEGSAIRIEIKSAADLAAVKQLARIKVAN